MSKKTTIAAILGLLLLASCNQRVDVTLFLASKPLSLSKDSVPAILAVPAGIVLHEGKAIVLDMESDWHFKAFSLEGFEYLGSFLRRGRGPGEEEMVFPFFRRNGDDGILFQGSNSVTTANINLNYEGIELIVTEEHELPVEMYGDTEFFQLNGKLYSSISYRPATKDFQGFCPETGEQFEWGELLPLKSPKAAGTGMPPFVMPKATTVKPDGQLLATVYGKLPIIRIYCAERGRILVEKHVADPTKNEEILLNPAADFVRNGLTNYYFGIKSTNDFIYALYSGQPADAFSMEGGRPRTPDVASEIHVWRWDGTPLKRLLLDRSIFAFDVTPDNQRIVAVSMVDVDYLFHAEIPWN